MAEEKKSTATSSPKTESSSADKSAAPAKGGDNGKGDAPRNCFSDNYRSNFDQINWSK